MEYIADKATYSPEDNKLRFYPFERLSEEVFTRAKDLGFRWAPRQELFVKPRWTPQAEDFCIELAGSIEPEKTTMIERAEAKIERLETIQENAETRANGYSDAAQAISERFACGQPILLGHHSQRKAENDAKKMQRAQANASNEFDKIKYYDWKKSGVACHANQKANVRTRQKRIKTLLAELRDMQRSITKSEQALKMWSDIDALPVGEQRTKYVDSYGGHHEYGTSVKNLYAWRRGELTEQQIINSLTEYHGSEANYAHRQRWIMHILNRLGYEQAELCDVPLFEGELTAPTIQTFLRTHGAEKPKALKIGDTFQADSPVNLPLHIGLGQTLSLTSTQWRDLMQSVGYAVPEKRAVKAQVPILNFKAKTILLGRGRGVSELEQISMTKAEYKYKYGAVIVKSPCGTFRARTIFQSATDGRFTGDYKAVFLTDSKEHAAPESLTNAAA